MNIIRKGKVYGVGKGTSWGGLRSSLACLEWQPKLSKSEASRPSCPPVSFCNTADDRPT